MYKATGWYGPWPAESETVWLEDWATVLSLVWLLEPAAYMHVKIINADTKETVFGY